MGLSRHGAALACSLLAFAAVGQSARAADPADSLGTKTPVKHLVVIFQENVSFDHYFATYPIAANPPGEPAFKALPNTPGLPGQGAIDTLASAGLLTNNPNKTNPANGADAADPFRLDITQAATADQNHGYTAEQAAYDNFAMDLFPRFTGVASKGGAGAFAYQGPGDGLLRRQHRHRALELRAAFRDERQFVRHDLRAFDAGRAQSRFRPDERRHPAARLSARRRRDLRQERHRSRRRGRLDDDRRLGPDAAISVRRARPR